MLGLTKVVGGYFFLVLIFLCIWFCWGFLGVFFGGECFFVCVCWGGFVTFLFCQIRFLLGIW